MLDFVKRHSISYLHYVIWVMGEIMAISLFFTFFTMFVIEEENNQNFTENFKNSIANVSILLLLPYSILWLYFRRRDKKQLIQFKIEVLENWIEQSRKEGPFRYYYFDDRDVVDYADLEDISIHEAYDELYGY